MGTITHREMITVMTLIMEAAVKALNIAVVAISPGSAAGAVVLWKTACLECRCQNRAHKCVERSNKLEKDKVSAWRRE